MEASFYPEAKTEVYHPEMERAGKNEPQPNAEPAWLLSYLSKMKADIKKEVIEEVFSMTFNKSMGDLQNVKRTPAWQKDDVVHDEIYCDHCDYLIRGIRYKCGNCTDFDLCQECENIPNVHNPNHIFLKIRYPMSLKVKVKRRRKESPIGETRSVPVLLRRTPSQTEPEITHKSKFFGDPGKPFNWLYDVKCVCDAMYPDFSILPPSTVFVKNWKVINTGTRAFTKETKLHYLQSPNDLIPSTYDVNVPLLKPGETGIVSVTFTCPAAQGIYQSYWQFRHKTITFGQCLWCNIKIVDPNNQSLGAAGDKEKNNLSTPPVSTTGDSKKRSPGAVKFSGLFQGPQEKSLTTNALLDIMTDIMKDTNDKQEETVPRKLAVASHTATPNNTPFDLTPPKSPDHQLNIVKVFTKVAKETTETTATSPKSNHGSDNDDDECSILSLSSSDSETEFVVIPMPKCFNMSESFLTHHLNHSLRSNEEHKDSVEVVDPEQIETTLKEAQKQCIKLNTANSKPAAASEAVSQETGVPEAEETIANDEKLVMKVKLDVATQHEMEGIDAIPIQITCLSLDGGESSSEISIIESEESSPIEEEKGEVVTPSAFTETISIIVSNSDSGETRETAAGQYHWPVVSVKESSTEETVANEEFDIPFGATFPKFPIQGVSDSEVVTIPSEEERTIQVLPESLVTGALSAAATVYNTARGIFHNIHQQRSERETCLSRDLPAPENVQPQFETVIVAESPNLNPMEQLIEMGFCNVAQNEQLLLNKKGDVAAVVAELVNLNDNDWYESRHAPPPPCTNFD